MTEAPGNVTAYVTQALMSGIGSRHAAADVLMEVAEAGSIGQYPHDVSGEVLGAAIWLMTSNSHEADILAAILRGWHQAEADRRASVGY